MKRTISAMAVTLALAGISATAAAAPGVTVQSAPGVTVHAAPLAKPVEFEITLPLQHEAELDKLLVQLHDKNSPLYHHWLTPQEFKAQYGANPDSVARITQHLQANGLQVVSVHSQGLHVRGTVASVQKALGVSLQVQSQGGKEHLLAAKGQTLRAELTNEGAMISSFTGIPLRHVHSKNLGIVPANRYGTEGPYWFTDIKQAYDFPAYPTLTGKGSTIAIVMSSDYSDADMTAFFGHEKLAVPKIIRKPILGGAPFDPVNNPASGEVSLDIQQAGGMAPDATIVLYNMPDLSDNSTVTTYQQIVEDNVADVVSSSYGGPETAYTAAYNNGTDYTYILKQTDQIFKQGNAQGITFVASSGDNGGLGVPSLDYFTNPSANKARWVPGVEFPASSPNVTAVGGTNLQTSVKAGSLDSNYVSENAFGDPLVPADPYGLGGIVSGGYWGSGGGVSVVFNGPDYQAFMPTGTNMRAVPDIALHEGGCPGTAVQPCAPDRSAVVAAVGGQYIGLIGTSVSAPEFAGVVALAKQRFGTRLGNINWMIYAEAEAQKFGAGSFYHTGIQGFNGYEYTQPIYNQVVGVGTPDVRQFLLAPYLPKAGTPKTPTNP